MKKLVSFLLLSSLTLLPSAFADLVSMDANDFASLPSCGGVVQTKIANDATQLNLIFSNVAQCSNFDIISANGTKVNYPNQKLQGRNQARAGSFTIPTSMIDYGSNTIRVRLQSNSGAHADTIVISVRAENAPRTATTYMAENGVGRLSVCGGSIETKVSNGQLNVIFRDVTECSNFDIVRANGDKVNYPNLKLGGKDGARSGSFTLPKSVIEAGLNTVRVQLKSNSGQTSETIVILFLAF